MHPRPDPAPPADRPACASCGGCTGEARSISRCASRRGTAP